LRAETTEAAHVEHQLRLHALAAPHIRFRLRRDDREVFDLPPAAKALDRVRQLLGNDLSRELLSLPLTHGSGISVQGYVLPASHARKGRRHQFVFLNGRPVEDAVISRALAEGFRGALADGLYPAAWLWIDLEPALVDVNVHPAKREVRFHRPIDVRETILEAVAMGLRPQAPAVSPRSVEAPAVFLPTGPDKYLPVLPSLPGPALLLPSQEVNGGLSAEMPTERTSVAVGGGLTEFRMLGLLHRRFVMLESADGLVLFDPKAAWERIFYEKIMKQSGGGLETQGLLVPVLLELDPRDMDLVLRERMALMDGGIEVEGFGGNTLQIHSLPACLPVDDPRAFLGALMDELLHHPAPGARFTLDRLARSLAKNASLRIVPRLAEVDSLLVALFACDLPYCAADGRPTLTEFSMKELDRRFGITKG
jgi:DNA mismatch repair protein MutL